MNFQKKNLSILIACMATGLHQFAQGITIDTRFISWGSLEESTIVDSTGNRLVAGEFFFDLGAFRSGFTPDGTNIAEWADNWLTADQAQYAYDGVETGVFASEFELKDETSQDGQLLGLEAYIWVYNSKTPTIGSEWFLARSESWVFPTLTGENNENDIPLQWSMGDLWSAGVTPLWGAQGGQEGSGEKTVFNPSADLQTFTFIPEPSSALLIAFAGALGVLRRSRQPKAV
jgi:hypothetical protein